MIFIISLLYNIERSSITMSIPIATVVPVKKPDSLTTNSEVAARVSVVGLVGVGLSTLVDKATQNPAVMAAIMGSVAMIPAVGQAVIVLGAVIAVGVYAVKIIKEQFSKYLKMLRTIDEFTILLHKIQKISNLTIFISTTYNFDINIDEVIEQMKIIFSRFDEVLKLEKDNYNKIEAQVMNPLTAAPDIENEAQQAIARSSELEIRSGAPGNELPNLQKGGGSGSQTGGAPLWWERFKFNIHEWNKQLNTDIIKLNIHLTTTMSEFSIILNVIQMNMVVNGLGSNSQEKAKAITELTKKNYVIKNSSEYRKTRVGILVHEILKLRIDFVYCKAKAGNSPLTLNPDDPLCKDHVVAYNTGNTFTNYRNSLHRTIERLIIRLKDGDYDDATKKSICDNVLIPYANMLTNAKLKGPTDKKEVLFAFTLTSLTPQEIVEVNSKLDKFIEGIPKDISGLKSTAGDGSVVMVGGWANIFKSNSDPTLSTSNSTSISMGGESAAEWEARKARESARRKLLNLLLAEPYNLVTDDEINAFLRKIYDYSKKVSQTSPDEIKKALEVAQKMIAPPPPTTLLGKVTNVASAAMTKVTNALPPGTAAKVDAAKAAVVAGADTLKQGASAAITKVTNALPPGTAAKVDAAKAAAVAGADTLKQGASAAMTKVTNALPPGTAAKVDAAKAAAVAGADTLKQGASAAMTNLTSSLSPDAAAKLDAAKAAAAVGADKLKQGASAAFAGFKGFFGKGGAGPRYTKKKARFVKHRSKTYKVRI
jgi:hypothetical protein